MMCMWFQWLLHLVIKILIPRDAKVIMYAGSCIERSPQMYSVNEIIVQVCFLSAVDSKNQCGLQPVLPKLQFWRPIGRLFKAFRGDYRNFSAEIWYSFQWDFRCLGEFLMLTTATFGDFFWQPWLQQCQPIYVTEVWIVTIVIGFLRWTSVKPPCTTSWIKKDTLQGLKFTKLYGSLLSLNYACSEQWQPQYWLLLIKD